MQFMPFCFGMILSSETIHFKPLHTVVLTIITATESTSRFICRLVLHFNVFAFIIMLTEDFRHHPLLQYQLQLHLPDEMSSACFPSARCR